MGYTQVTDTQTGVDLETLADRMILLATAAVEEHLRALKHSQAEGLVRLVQEAQRQDAENAN